MFGERAEEATTKELQQIHDFGTYIPQDAKLLSREERSKDLSALMFIVENRNRVYQNCVSAVFPLWWTLLRVRQTTLIPSSDFIVELISHPANALSSYHHIASLHMVPITPTL